MSDIHKIMEAYLSMVSEKKELDPVDDKALDKKFKDRKDKDIDNDGDVDSSDEYLHKRRKAIDKEIDGDKKSDKKEVKEDSDEIDEESQPKWKVKIGNKSYTVTARNTAEAGKKAAMMAKKAGNSGTGGKIERLSEEEDSDEEEDPKKKKSPFPPKKDGEEKDSADSDDDNEVESDDEEKPKVVGKKEKDKNPKTSDKTAEISKIGENRNIDTKEHLHALWSAMAEAMDRKKSATPPEEMDSKASPKEKEFVAKHAVDKMDHDELQKIEEPKERKVKKEMTEYEVIRELLSGNLARK